ncbi:hemolysin [Trichosporon asahii var. asahii CBS 2479]|uniref:Hemolysin n=1 Tax=Trichosporon asahii var. asahii (strain ATCC 90039 / CBS 2479 / JCM 2466 / KCTC 7840 / NBRC 103889/ NCYC 2677 / UAMH 7654) TaxID=1186058 RepID=J4UA79_TRIAS|nr:hemolysin [Trichosporon asahii var. asahii CBS 2479]EJT47625.1 hemolysin [Trichosporon asahii var. asahii CBS 2479]
MGLLANASLVELCGPVCSELQDIAHIAGELRPSISASHSARAPASAGHSLLHRSTVPVHDPIHHLSSQLTAGSTKKHVHITPSDPEFWWFVGISALLVLLADDQRWSVQRPDARPHGPRYDQPAGPQPGGHAGRAGAGAQGPQAAQWRKTYGARCAAALTGNTLVNTSLPIFLDNIIGGGVIAILGATALEAICNKYGLAIGATFAPLVKGMIILLYPIAKPIALVLDYLFGAHDDGVTYRKAELKAFVALGVEDKLADEELALLGSVLEFSGKTVSSVMLPANRMVDKDLLAEILRKGHTRIPVYDPARPGYFVYVEQAQSARS